MALSPGWSRALLVAVALGSLCLLNGLPSVAARWIDPIASSREPVSRVYPCAAPDGPALPAPAVSASAWALYDPSSGSLLGSANEHARRFPASLTKIATAIVALESGSLAREAVVDIDYRSHLRSSDLGLRPGMRITLGDLFTGMLTVSGNDAAEELATEVAGDEPAFVAKMNALAHRLGLENTGFANSHGRDREGLYSTAHDLALLAAEAMRHPEFREAVSRRSNTITVDGTAWTLANTNRFLGAYPGATGIKTGFTVLGGPSLAASAQRSGHELIVVTLNDQRRFEDAGALLDWGFTAFTWRCSD